MFAGTGNFRFESLSQNPAAKNFKKRVRKDDFDDFCCFVKLIFWHNSVQFQASE
jgi:hypothetical protein